MSRAIFMGTPEFAVPGLRALVDMDAVEVVGVVTQPDRPAGRGRSLRQSAIKQSALELGLPVFQPETLRDPQAVERLRAWQPDVIVVAAFGQILRQNVLDLPPWGCLNVHASLLPRWRGARDPCGRRRDRRDNYAHGCRAGYRPDLASAEHPNRPD